MTFYVYNLDAYSTKSNFINLIIICYDVSKYPQSIGIFTPFMAISIEFNLIYPLKPGIIFVQSRMK